MMKMCCKVSMAALATVLIALPAKALPSGYTAAILEHNQTNMPPITAEYIQSTNDTYHIDLPGGGTQFVGTMGATHQLFTGMAVAPGGSLGGEVETFNSQLVFEIKGEGPFKGWTRTLVIPALCETHTGPRQRDAAVQAFETNMQRIQGRIQGDKDFEYFEIIAGTANGFDSPGYTTLFRQEDGRYLVDSKFNIHFQARFKGAKGSRLDGIEDIFEGRITMVAVADRDLQPVAPAAAKKAAK